MECGSASLNSEWLVGDLLFRIVDHANKLYE
jgi:hypothetical protein